MDKDSEAMEQKQNSPDAQETPEIAPAEGSELTPETDEGQPGEMSSSEAAPEDEIRLELDASAPVRKDEDTAQTDALSAAPAATCPAGPLGRIFDALSHAGLLVLLVLCALMTCAEVLQIRDLWFSDEVRLADVFLHLHQGDWLTLTLNGVPYPDKPPLYFWAMQALSLIPGISVPMAVFLAAAVSHALFTVSVWVLARGTGHDRCTALAAGLLTLCCVYVSGAACYPRMDLLFSALIILAMTCLYRGWIRPAAPFWLGAGFLLLGLSTLVKGPLGIAFAVVVSVLFLVWRGTPGRLNGRDGLPGFVLMLVLILTWIGALSFSGKTDYLYEMLGVQLLGRLTDGAPHALPWWYYLAALPLMWLPWILIALFVNWLAAVRGIPAAWKARKTDGGSSWLWIWLVSGAALLSAVPSKLAVYALPLLAPLAVLTARSLLKLTPGRSRWFFRLVAFILFAAGLVLTAADAFPFVQGYIPDGWLPPVPPVAGAWLNALHGSAIMGGILILTAVLLLAVVCLDHPGGALLITALGMTAMAVPYELAVAPGLGEILSPRAQAEVMLEKMKDGYTPAAFKVYPGVYAWHLNQLSGTADTLLTVPDLKDAAALGAWLAQHPRTVLAMSEKEWEAWADKPSTASVLLRTWMVDKPYVVAAMDATPPAPRPDEEAAPAASEAQPSEQPAAAPSAPADPAKTDSAPAEPSAPEAPAPSGQPALSL